MSAAGVDKRRSGGDGGKRKTLSPVDSAVIRHNSWLSHIPLLSAGMMAPAAGPDLGEVTAQIAKGWPSDFCWSSCFDAQFIAALMYQGYLPTAHGPLDGPHEHVLLPKLHQQRCVMQ
ncbi:hypothetical protein T484DRAFT_1807539, partial [Baffinella frigidus]